MKTEDPGSPPRKLTPEDVPTLVERIKQCWWHSTWKAIAIQYRSMYHRTKDDLTKVRERRDKWRDKAEQANKDIDSLVARIEDDKQGLSLAVDAGHYFREKLEKTETELDEQRKNASNLFDLAKCYQKRIRELEDLHRPRRYPDEVPEDVWVWVQIPVFKVGDTRVVEWQMRAWQHMGKARLAIGFLWLPLAALPTGNEEEKGTGE